MRRSLGALLALTLLAAAAPGGNYASRLDGLGQAVRDGLEGFDPEFGTPLSFRAILRADRILGKARVSLADDFRRALPVARLIEKWWPETPLLVQALDDAAASLRDGALGERVALAAWTGHAKGASGEARLVEGLASFDALLAQGDAEETRTGRIDLWGRAAALSRRVRRAVRPPTPVMARARIRGEAPDFTLLDENTSSATSGQSVAPSGHRGELTAWYFTRLT